MYQFKKRLVENFMVKFFYKVRHFYMKTIILIWMAPKLSPVRRGKVAGWVTAITWV